MASNYDNSAYFYDRLSRVVFGKALVKAQVYLLPNIPPNSSVLIVGGGTGWILEEITRLQPSGLQITYVEISANMMVLSRKRNTGGNRVSFINQPIEKVTLQPHDVVITPFLLDNFTEASLTILFATIHNLLKPGGLWLNTDFQLTGKWWQFVLLKSMLFFFKVLCGIESWRLPDIPRQFNNAGYRVIKEQTFFGKFIVTCLYNKPA